MTNTGIEPSAFRELLGRFATGVTVVTTVAEDATPAGMTANAVTSVSLDPPLLLICVGKDTTMINHLARAEHFVINVLASDQEYISRHFAEPRDDRFSGVGYRPGPHGIPLLDGALAHIECTKHSSFDAGDHTVFLGLVIGGTVETGDPLIFYRGGYVELNTP